MKDIITIIEIVASICAVLGVIIKAVSFLGQTSISITLMSHEERQKYQLAQKIIVYASLYVFSFAVGMFLNLDRFRLQINRIEGGRLGVVLSLVAFVLTLIALCFFINSDRKTKRKQSILSWLLTILLLFLIFLTLLSNVIGSSFLSKMDSLKLNAVFSFFLVMFFWTLVQIRGISSDEVAYLKVHNDNGTLYLFELQGEYLVAGDKRNYEECSYYKLIKVDELKEPLMKAWCEQE